MQLNPRPVSRSGPDGRLLTLDYIADMARGLAEMAADAECPALTRVLALAEEEARRSMAT